MRRLAAFRWPPIDYGGRTIVAHPNNRTHLRSKVIGGRFDQPPIIRLEWLGFEQKPGCEVVLLYPQTKLLCGALIRAQTNRGLIRPPLEGQHGPSKGGKIVPRALETYGRT